jgi:hypothetical protein
MEMQDKAQSNAGGGAARLPAPGGHEDRHLLVNYFILIGYKYN